MVEGIEEDEIERRGPGLVRHREPKPISSSVAIGAEEMKRRTSVTCM